MRHVFLVCMFFVELHGLQGAQQQYQQAPPPPAAPLLTPRTISKSEQLQPQNNEMPLQRGESFDISKLKTVISTIIASHTDTVELHNTPRPQTSTTKQQDTIRRDIPQSAVTSPLSKSAPTVTAFLTSANLQLSPLHTDASKQKKLRRQTHVIRFSPTNHQASKPRPPTPYPAVSSPVLSSQDSGQEDSLDNLINQMSPSRKSSTSSQNSLSLQQSPTHAASAPASLNNFSILSQK